MSKAMKVAGTVLNEPKYTPSKGYKQSSIRFKIRHHHDGISRVRPCVAWNELADELAELKRGDKFSGEVFEEDIAYTRTNGQKVEGLRYNIQGIAEVKPREVKRLPGSVFDTSNQKQVDDFFRVRCSPTAPPWDLSPWRRHLWFGSAAAEDKADDLWDELCQKVALVAGYCHFQGEWRRVVPDFDMPINIDIVIPEEPWRFAEHEEEVGPPAYLKHFKAERAYRWAPAPADMETLDAHRKIIDTSVSLDVLPD